MNNNSSNEVNNSFVELFDGLISATKGGALKWNRMSINGHYVTILKDMAVCIGKLPEEEEKIYYSVLRPQEGKTLYKLTFTPQDDLYNKLNELYTIVQLDDERIKDITDSLISGLKNMKGVTYSSLMDVAPVAE